MTNDICLYLEAGRIISEKEMKEIDSKLEKDVKRYEFFEKHPFLKKIRDKYKYFKLSGDFGLAIKYNP